MIDQEKPQISPLRYARVEMTNLLQESCCSFSWKYESRPTAELSSRPERTRISCHAALDKAACAPFFKERRMMFASATNFYRKSGVAEWRDLRFLLVARPSPRQNRPTFPSRDDRIYDAQGTIQFSTRHEARTVAL
jgi:hypothetical protein